MKQKKVIEIVIPCQEAMPNHPAVTVDDKIVKAVELMVNHGLHQIAVVHSNRTLGMIRLEDAFRELGLQGTALTLKGRVIKLQSL